MADRYYRKVIHITAQESPNVRYALAQIAVGQQPTGEVIIPGVLTWEDYQKRRATWDKELQCVSLEARFYEGPEQKLFPPEWLSLAVQTALRLGPTQRKAKAIGIDPAEGGDKTSMCAVDELGVIELCSKKTPDTNVVIGEAIAFMRNHNVPPEMVIFDRGGGGKQHADRLRAGVGIPLIQYKVRTVAFGESPSLEPKRGLVLLERKIEMKEERYAYANLRAEMYGQLSLLMDPGIVGRDKVFAIPHHYQALFHQLSKFPRRYGPEGRLELPPKNKRDPSSKTMTLVEMIGHSPDESDSLVLAVHALLHKPARSKVLVG